MRKTLLLMLALSTMAILLATPAFAPTYPPDLELTASAWHILNPNTSATLHNDGAGALYFDFPVEPNRDCTNIGDGVECDYVNYLWTDHVPSSVSGMLSIRMRVDVLTGYPDIVFEDTQHDQEACSNNPPAVRALMWGSTSLNDKRFWSNAYFFALGPMEWDPTNGWTVTLNIPIDPALWSDNDGVFASDPSNENSWNQTINHTRRLAVTFGGHCNFGHGIFVRNGTARFTIENYEVMPLPPNCPSASPCPGLTGDCTRGAETGATNQSMSRCLQGDTSPPIGGSLVDCGSQSVYLVTTTCQHLPCCTAVPFPCLCFQCPGGSYLECR
jgi:hypothetical protein